MAFEKREILIVDDERPVCEILHDELSERGYLCAIAVDGNEALTKLLTYDFELVLLDLRLPGMTGMEILVRIRVDHPNTKTIVITAVNDILTVVKAMQIGASDYILKPFSLDGVVTSIRRVLESKKHVPERMEHKSPRCIGAEKEEELALEESDRRMNAIACGVEARFDSLFGYSDVVTQSTIEIAKQFSIPNETIQRWVAMRLRKDAERNALIKSLLKKLEGSPLAQSMMGIAVPYVHIVEANEPKN